jgi:GxxExxY protein
MLNKIYIPDLFVYGKIVVELKAQKSLENGDKAQLINYLKVTQVNLGILLNFGNADSLESKRLLRKGVILNTQNIS